MAQVYPWEEAVPTGGSCVRSGEEPCLTEGVNQCKGLGKGKNRCVAKFPAGATGS